MVATLPGCSSERSRQPFTEPLRAFIRKQQQQQQQQQQLPPNLKGSLRRLLRCYAVRNESVGYCQSLNFLAGALLLHCDEEGAFWLLCALCERLLPDYFSCAMSGLLADRDVLLGLIKARLPAVFAAVEAAGPMLPLAMVLARWLLPLFFNALPPAEALVVWDALFLDGPAVLIAAAFGAFASRASELCAVEPAMLVIVLTQPLSAAEVLGGLYTPSGHKSSVLKAARSAREKAHARRLAAQLSELRAAIGSRLHARKLESLVARLRAVLHAGEGATDVRVLMPTGAFAQILQEEAPGCNMPAQLLHGLFDTDKDGQLDLREILVGLCLLQRGSTDELLRACFRAYDTDESGFLERAELSALIARVYRFVLSDGETDGVEEAKGAAALVTRDAFAHFDANGDERLSFLEFAAIVHSDYLLASWFQLQVSADSAPDGPTGGAGAFSPQLVVSAAAAETPIADANAVPSAPRMAPSQGGCSF